MEIMMFICFADIIKEDEIFMWLKNMKRDVKL